MSYKIQDELKLNILVRKSDYDEPFASFMGQSKHFPNSWTIVQNILQRNLDGYTLMLSDHHPKTQTRLHQFYKTCLSPRGEDVAYFLSTLDERTFQHYHRTLHALFHAVQEQITPQNQSKLRQLIEYEKHYKTLFH